MKIIQIGVFEDTDFSIIEKQFKANSRRNGVQIQKLVKRRKT